MHTSQVPKSLFYLSVKPVFIEPGDQWEDGYIKSFNGLLRDELLVGAIFDSLKEAQVLIEMGQRHDNPV